MTKSVFITLEGGDGAGKSTQITLIKKWLEQMRIDVVTTREPGGTDLGEHLREIALQNHHWNLTHEAELLLMFAARAQHIDEVIKPALQRGAWVLCDRFTDASFAYQGGGRGMDLQRIAHLEKWLQQGFQPDLTIILDLDIESGLSRTQARNSPLDSFEGQHMKFKQRVRQTYLQIAQQSPHRVKVVDASHSVQQVHKDILAVLNPFFKINKA